MCTITRNPYKNCKSWHLGPDQGLQTSTNVRKHWYRAKSMCGLKKLAWKEHGEAIAPNARFCNNTQTHDNLSTTTAIVCPHCNGHKYTLGYQP